jgi:CheY-like chemotaxis protein
MDPVVLLMAAGAYVAAELAKKSADSVISAAYKKLESYVTSKLGCKTPPEQIDAPTFRGSGLADDPVVIEFGREVLARSSALRRAKLAASALKGARVLWVDDNPGNNLGECRLLRALGVEIEQVRSTPDALCELSRARFDLLLSDMDREGAPDAGLRMLGQLGRAAPPVVFYVGRVDQSRGVPRGAVGIADRPELLLHLALDVLERSRV